MNTTYSSSSQALNITLLGPFRLLQGSTILALAPGSRLHALLAFLLLNHRRPIERSYLAAQLDPELPDTIARRRLSDTLYLLRRMLPGPHLQSNPSTVSLVLSPDDSCDLLQLEQNLQQTSSPQENIALLSLPEPIFCPELDKEWVLIARETLRLRFLSYLEQSAKQAIEQEDFRTARAFLLRIVQLEPIQETAEVMLLHVFEAVGSPTEAAQQYEQWKQRLEQDFGFSPEPETERYYQRLMRTVTRATTSQLIQLPEQMPLTGRDAERRRILSYMDQASSQPTLLLLEGMPGIGKTHLLAHIIEDAQWRDWQIASACANTRSSTIENALGILLTPLQREQLRHSMPDIWWQRLKTIFPCNGTRPIPEPTAEPERYRELILCLIEALTSYAPLLLILDDMHAASESDLSLLAQIVTLKTRQALLIISSYRSSVRDDPERWRLFQQLDSLSPGHRLVLDSLQQQDCAALLKQILGPCSIHTIEQLSSFSAGHPLFLREILQLLIEKQAIQRYPDGSWGFLTAALQRQSPSNAAQAIRLRVQQLQGVDSDILAALAIHEDSLTPEQLSRSIGQPAQLIIKHAQILRQRHLLQIRSDGYSCAHALIAQAIHEHLGPDAKCWHCRLFAALGDQTQLNALRHAEHALVAEQWEAALPLLLQAAVAARQRANYRSALEIINKALEACSKSSSPEERHHYQIELLFERLNIWQWYPPESPEQPAQDLQTLELLIAEQAVLQTRLTIARIDYLFDLASYQMAFDLAHEQLARLDANANPTHVIQLHLQLGKAAQILQRASESMIYLQQAKQLAAKHGQIEAEVAALGHIAIAQHYAGDFEAARAGYTQVSQLCEQHGLIMAGLVANANLAAIEQAQGNLAAAISGYERTIASCERYATADPPDLENLAEIMIQVGDFPRAERLLTRAEDLWQERGGSPALTRCRQAMLAIACQSFKQAQDILNTARALNTSSGDQRVAGEILIWQALIDLEQGCLKLLKPCLEQARILYDQMGVKLYTSLIDGLDALGLARQGQLENARAVVYRAEASLDQSASTFLDPRYFLGLTMEILGNRSHAGTLFEAAAQRIQQQSGALPDNLATTMINAPYNRRILLAARRQKASNLVYLPLKNAAAGRPLHAWEKVGVVWSLPEGLKNISDRAARQRLLEQLIQQARDQEAEPGLAALAKVLGVSTATISRDLKALRF